MKKPLKIAPRRPAAPAAPDRTAAVASALRVDRAFADDVLVALACPATWPVQMVVDQAVAWFD